MSKENKKEKSSDDEYVKSTVDGKLYINTSDLFSQKEVQDLINDFLKSDMLKAIVERNKNKVLAQ